MSYPISASPYAGSNQSPVYTGNFIPTIWAGKLVEKFYDTTVLGAIANTDYEGEIKSHGDTVRIRTKPSVTISNYEVNQALSVQRPSSAYVDLSINKGKYFNTVLDDVMKIQSDVDLLNAWSDDATSQLKVSIDTDVLAVATFATDVVAANKGATAGRISASIDIGITTGPCFIAPAAQGLGDGSTNANDRAVVDFLIDLGLILDEQNVPETGRWVVVPAWLGAMLKRSDLKDASITGDSVSIARNGRVGMIDRFTVYVSNLLPNGVAGGLAAGEWAVYAGHKNGLTFASQMTNTETLRAESTFGTLLRGLQIYGFKVVDGTMLVYAVVAKG
jgi:hypothetical protein